MPWCIRLNEAGGDIYEEPALINGWMYGIGFQDPDGHRWNHVYMDFSKAPTADSEPSS